MFDLDLLLKATFQEDRVLAADGDFNRAGMSLEVVILGASEPLVWGKGQSVWAEEEYLFPLGGFTEQVVLG